MKRESRARRIAFHRALWLSVALHTVVVGALLLFLWSSEDRQPAKPGIDTRAASEPQVRIALVDTELVSAEPPPKSPINDVKPQEATSPPPAPALPPGPLSPAIPRTLPPELFPLIHKPTVEAAGPAVVEVPVPPSGMNVARTSPAQPTGMNTVGVNANAKGNAPGAAPAIHGALAPNTTIVYVLDCSGSMGAEGKFDVARSALVSTLRQQPATVRFQVIVYCGTATPLLVTNGTALAASEANVRTAVEKLTPLEARGKSNHLAAIQAALIFRPDVILVLTDADDLGAAALKSLLASAPTSVRVCVGQVTVGGVQRPRELK
jgi:hypothetical protein